MTLRQLIYQFCILCVLATDLCAQLNETRIYTVADGLPNTECTRVMIDAEGYLYVGNHQGNIVRYDGIEFEPQSLATSDLPLQNMAFQRDKNGLWIINHREPWMCYKRPGSSWTTITTPENELVYYDYMKDQMVVYQHSGQLLQFDQESESWQPTTKLDTTFLRDRNQQVYSIYPYRDTSLYLVVTVDAAGNYACYQSDLSSTTPLPPISFPVFYPSQAFSIVNTDFNEYQFYSIEQARFTPIEYLEIDGTLHLIEYVSYFQVFRGGEIRIVTRAEEPGHIHPINTLVVGKPGEAFSARARWTMPSDPLKVDIDRAGHIWLATHSGLVQVNPEVVQIFDDQPNMISALHAINEDSDGKVWFGGYHDGFSYFNGSSVIRANLPDIFNRVLPGSYRDEQGNMFFFTEYGGLVWQDGSAWRMSKREQIIDCDPFLCTTGYEITRLADGRLAAGLHVKGLGLTTFPLSPDNQWEFIDSIKGMYLTNVLSITEDRKGRLWLGRGSQGISIYDLTKDTAETFLIADYEQLGFGSISSTLDDRGNLWWGAHDGLRWLRDPHEVNMFEPDFLGEVKKMGGPDLEHKMVTYVKQVENFLVFGNTEGHALLDLTSFYENPDQPKIYFFNTADQALGGASEQNTILYDSRGGLWLGKDRGTIRVNLQDLFLDTTPASIQIQNIFAGGELVSLPKNLNESVRLPLARRSVTINFRSTFNGFLTDHVTYQTRLLSAKGDTTTYMPTVERRLSYAYLPPGMNRVEISAIKHNQKTDTVVIQLLVPPTLAENTLFWLALWSVLGLIIGGFMFYRYRQRLIIKQKDLEASEARREKEKFQIQAITNSLNPHFINNSLSYIQWRIQDDDEGIQVLSRLAKNIRSIFQRSQNGKAYHTLAEELELVENYITIQQARYGHTFDVSLPHLSEYQHLSQINVPLMQIQIHVENAIEHGLRNRPQSRKLKVNIWDKNDYLDIKVTDWGIGRPAAKKLASQGTQQGVTMLNNLHSIFNKGNPQKIKSWYEDTPFCDHTSGIEYGTIVHILIPKHYCYEPTST